MPNLASRNQSGHRNELIEFAVPAKGPGAICGISSGGANSFPRARVNINPGNAPAMSLRASRRLMQKAVFDRCIKNRMPFSLGERSAQSDEFSRCAQNVGGLAHSKT